VEPRVSDPYVYDVIILDERASALVDGCVRQARETPQPVIASRAS
jgi:hypothetical protein